ncbi:MAG: serine acetyltransferase [Phycisphaerales bacterium]|nr:serine acetyltransferase [Phycisphaerales bacterium]
MPPNRSSPQRRKPDKGRPTPPTAPSDADARPGDLVERLARSILAEPVTRHLGPARLPDRRAVGELVETLRELMFPGFFGRRGVTKDTLTLHVQDLLTRLLVQLSDQIAASLRYAEELGGLRGDQPGEARRPRHAADPAPADEDAAGGRLAACVARGRELAQSFADGLPEMRRLLALDVKAAFDGDPAAKHSDETILCYPGVEAVFAHRAAHALHRLGVPLLPRIIAELAHSRTGIDIHPGASIGESFFIDHGGGVVIGETARIGHHVRLYQGVTLGARSFEMDEHRRIVKGGGQRHPTIGDRVIIYANAVILGGDTVIGDDCIISGSVFLTRSVPPGHVVRHHAPDLSVRSRGQTTE